MRSMTIMITYLFLSANVNCQSLPYDRFINQLLFNQNKKKFDASLLASYKSNAKLAYESEKNTSWVAYPPLADTNLVTTKYKFIFNSHLFVPFTFKYGSVNVSTIKIDSTEDFERIELCFTAATKQEIDNAFKFLVDAFSKLATRRKFNSHEDAHMATFVNDNSTLFKQILFYKTSYWPEKKGYVIQFIFKFDNELIIEKMRSKANSQIQF
ncbi:MAG: hypothetical protein H7101_00660 [Deinococcales bacterium]|nr:hypothetical protein [Chitinophagaceae bacterium]